MQMKSWRVKLWPKGGHIIETVVQATDSYRAREVIWAQYGKDINIISISPD